MEKIEPIKTIQYATIEDLPLEADFYKATGDPIHKTILYYHGGGLIYGTRKDLPNHYLNQFLEAGYHVLAFDYPLTPESSFAQMISKVEESLEWFLKKGEDLLPIKSTDYILFGRSAGAYLANYLTKTSHPKKPLQLILLYGYYNLTDVNLTAPSPSHNKLMKVDSRVFYSSIQKKPITSGQVEKRYLMYLYLRQTGSWPFLPIDSRENYSLTKDDFKHFPKTFIAYSEADEDVPPTQSKEMLSFIPSTTVFTVDCEEHDFDLDPSKSVAKELYKKITQWLE